MKINFDEFFSQPQPLSTLPLSLIQSQPTKLLNQEQNQINQQPYFSLNNKSKQQININNHHHSISNRQTVIQKLTQMTQIVQQQKYTYRKQNKVNIEQLSNKLYRPTPTTKKNCTKNCKHPIQQSPQQTSRQNTKRTYCTKSTDQPQFPRYVRLYNLDKINNIRSLYRAESHQAQFDRINSMKIVKTKTSESYLQNYVPFYNRLENEVNRSAQKIKFYENNPQYSCGQQKQLFKPTTIDDKYKKKIESRYKQGKESCQQTKATKQLQNILNSSINTSYSLDKSIEIMNQVQEHFFNKMKLIFFSEHDRYVTITEHHIQMLTDVEFRILHNFIIQAQYCHMTNNQFESRLREYYYNLQPHEKLELRSHEAKRKNKIKQDRQQKRELNKKEVRQANKKISHKLAQYHKKVQNFI